ncbi:MAG: tyrosine phenol-lyase, partial [Elusimicrobia bacterium RIFCSPLOWO2_12_FULL_59_9]
METQWKTIIEPFKIKSVEPLGFSSRAERKKLLERAGYNLFNIPADKVLIDYLTDSGTNAMSSEQWSAIMRGDESYAGARSFFVFESAIQKITGYKKVIPVHQGRAAERILFAVIGGPGKYVLANTLFDTTRANVEGSGSVAVDLPVKSASEFQTQAPFKGNVDLKALEQTINDVGPQRVALVLMTVTNNAMGGQPASIENLKGVRKICSRYRLPFLLDAARFAENAYLIKMREPACRSLSIPEIARRMFDLADGCLVSAKKDGLTNIGGFMALNNEEWVRKAKEILILGEGFPTYGGLAGRDLEAIARGLEEVLDEEYLKYRIRSVEYLGKGLKKAGVPIVEPPGGHAIYVDVKSFLPHIPPYQFPGQALACALYLEAGIRSFEIGSLSMGSG